MLSRFGVVAVLAAVLVPAAMTGAQAQQPTSVGQQATAAGWTFNVAPYGWFATIGTGLSYNLPPALGGTVTASPSIGFGDILSHLNFATMIAADAQYGRFSAVTDFMYLNLGGTDSQLRSINFPGQSPIPITAAVQTSEGLNLDAKIWTLAGGYTVLQGDWGNFDVIAGFRYLGVNARTNYSLALTVTGPRGNGATFGGIGSVSGSVNIWNGIGGFRGRLRISNTGFFIPYYFDVGAGGSNLTWQISSGVGYQTGWAGVSLTYRYLSFEQGSSALVQHLWIRGPMLMMNITF